MPSQEFDIAAADVKKLKTKPDNDELLKLYSLYKQATEGDNYAGKPGMFDLKGKYKWDAWESLKGTSQDDAGQQYIAFVNELKAKHGF